MHDVSAARARHAAEHGPEYMYSPEWTKFSVHSSTVLFDYCILEW
jgi:hypothetical protein